MRDIGFHGDAKRFPTVAKVGKPVVIAWQLNRIPKGMVVRVKFAKDGGTYKVINSTTANKTGIGRYTWKPAKKQVTENGQILICAKPAKKAAEVCSPATRMTIYR